MKAVVSRNGNKTGPASLQACLRADQGANTGSAKSATSFIPAGGGETAMDRVNLAGLLFQATPYESWRAPIHPKLRWTAMASGPAVALCLPIVLAILAIFALSLAEALLISDPVAWLLGALCALLTFLVVLDLASLLVYIAMMVCTDALREARPHWQYIAFGEAVLGAIHGFVVAVGLAIVVVASVIGLLMVCLLVVAAIAGLIGMALGSTS